MSFIPSRLIRSPSTVIRGSPQIKQFKVLESFTNPNLRFLFGSVPGLGLGLGSCLGSCLGSSSSNHWKSYLPLEFFIEDFLERYAFPIPCSVKS